MHIRPLLLLFAGVLASISRVTADTPSPPFPITLTLRVEWRTTTLSSYYTGDALNEAAALWSAYGVQCRRVTSGAAVTVVVDDELRGATSARIFPLGWVIFEHGAPDPVLHASAAATQRLVESASFAGRSLVELPVAVHDRLIARALGRAVAHEIGHYLLASPAHTSRGLMRETFSPQEVVAADRASFTLGAAQLQRVQQRP